jgi:hypothetical protein
MPCSANTILLKAAWISPDAAGLAAGDITNPQTWNRYADVANNLLSFIDALGLSDCPEGKTCPPPVVPSRPL